MSSSLVMMRTGVQFSNTVSHSASNSLIIHNQNQTWRSDSNTHANSSLELGMERDRRRRISDGVVHVGRQYGWQAECESAHHW